MNFNSFRPLSLGWLRSLEAETRKLRVCGDLPSLFSPSAAYNIPVHIPSHLQIALTRGIIMALDIPKVLLILLSVAGFWTLWGFPYQNGLLEILTQETKPGALIPGPTVAPMKQTYTGIDVIDKELTTLVSFFYTAIDGNRADVSLSFFYLGGQVLASWVLIMIEGLRNGNRGRFILTA